MRKSHPPVRSLPPDRSRHAKATGARRKARGNEKVTKAAAKERAETLAAFKIDEANLVAGKDSRTTLMLRNIPNSLSAADVMEILDMTLPCKGMYDFFYLPMDSKGRNNVGYAFVNVSNAADIPLFYSAMLDFQWCSTNKKYCTLSYGSIQGLEELQKARDRSDSSLNFLPRRQHRL